MTPASTRKVSTTATRVKDTGHFLELYRRRRRLSRVRDVGGAFLSVAAVVLLIRLAELHWTDAVFIVAGADLLLWALGRFRVVMRLDIDGQLVSVREHELRRIRVDFSRPASDWQAIVQRRGSRIMVTGDNARKLVATALARQNADGGPDNVVVEAVQALNRHPGGAEYLRHMFDAARRREASRLVIPLGDASLSELGPRERIAAEVAITDA